jgi:DNA polymerase III subunit gamma/tau
LPTPDELVRQVTEGGGAVASRPAGGAGYSPSASTGPSPNPSPQGGGGNAPVMRSTDGPRMQLAARTETPQPAQQAQPGVAVATFADLVLLAEDKRDIKLKTMLRRNLRMISFADGRMEFSLAGDPPPTFVSELAQKLQTLTGRRWTLAVSRAQGQPTLDEQERAEAGEREEAARHDPVVDAILKRFPGARIVDVKVRGVEPDAAEAELAEAERREGLDDFLE